MIRQFLIILLIVSLISLADSQGVQPISLADSQGVQPIPAAKSIATSKVGERIKGVNYKLDQGKSYQLIQLADLQRKYLFFSLKSDSIYFHLNFSMTIYKQSEQNLLHRCIKDELDSCYLPKQSLSPNLKLLIVIESGEDSEYELQTYWSNLEHMMIDKQVKFMFSKTQKTQIYHLELQGKEFEQLRITIKPLTRRFAFDKIKIYGSFGVDSQPSSENYDFKSVHLWQDAEGIYLSRKQLKQLNMNLIVLGEVETIYTMLCTLVNKTHTDIGINHKIHEYLDKQKSVDYHLNFKNKNGELQYDTYAFRIAIISGDLEISFYNDKNKTQKIGHRQPAMYMGDIEYFYAKKDIQQNYSDGIYITITSKYRTSTFMMQVQGRMQQKAFELHQHIYQFLSAERKQTLYFKVARFGEENQNEVQSMKVVLTLINAVGKVGVYIRKCLKTFEQCTGEDLQKNTVDVQLQKKQIGSKLLHSWNLTTDFWSNINPAQKNALIIVVIANLMQSQSIAIIEYNVGNRPQLLRQYKPIESHIVKQQLKVYKYVNQDPNIKSIRVHINKISGNFNSYFFRHQPSDKQLRENANRIRTEVLQISQDLIETPLVVVVRGQDSATYSIVVQPVHQEQYYTNSITLSEDIQFKIKIGPNKYEIFEINPISYNVYFSYRSTGGVHVCTLNNDNLCTDIQNDGFTNQGQIQIESFSGRTLYIKLRNPYSNRTIEVVSVFHSKSRSVCERRKMNQLYKQVISQGDCLSTEINVAKDFQVLIVREELGIYVYVLLLCNQSLDYTIGEGDEGRYRISVKQIEDRCKGRSQIVFSLLAGMPPDPSSDVVTHKKAHLKYLVQYSSDKIILPDGVGYHGIDVSTESELKIFTYGILNVLDTEIIIQTSHKLYILVKIISSVDTDLTKINSNNYHFSSLNQKYYRQDCVYLKINADKISQSQCTNCQLLIYVYSKEEIGRTVEYNIEVIQNFIVLDEGAHKKGFLLQQSKAYYGFNTKSKGNLIVQLNDNNRNCAQIYVSNKQYPDSSNYLQKSFDGQIIQQVQHSKQQTFYITVKAKQNCEYSIVAVLSKREHQIRKLRRGLLAYSNMKQGQVRYFTFRHLSDKPFKIFSLHKYGHVEIYLNKTEPLQVTQLLNQNQIQYKQFSYHGKYKNRLIMDASHQQFCKGCYYIIAVQAVKHTESSIFLGDEETKVPITQGKIISDILPKEGNFTKGQFYYMKDVMVEVKVHSGKLSAQFTYSGQFFTQIFVKNQSSVFYNFTIESSEIYYGMVEAVFKALGDNTVYSIIIKRTFSYQADSKGIYIAINPVQSTYIYVLKGTPTCLTGFLKRNDEKIFLSFRTKQKDSVSKLSIAAKIDDNQTEIIVDTVRNVISITFADVINQTIDRAKSFQLCLSHQSQSIPITVMQSEQASLLPQNTEMIVIDKQTYDIYPEGDFLLDVFECRGKAKVSYGTSRSDLLTGKSKQLQRIGISDQAHAIRIDSRYSNILFSVEAELALMRWFAIDQSQEKGLGYYIYKAGSVSYDSSFRIIDVTIEPIKAIRQTNTTLESVVYNLYISDSQQDLKEASLCERFLPQSVLAFKTIQYVIASNPFIYEINKKTLIEKYQGSSNLFFTVVADVSIITYNETEEEYRFVYATSEIPAQILTLNTLESSNLLLTLTIILSIIVLIVVFTWACVRVIVPMVSRLRSRVLVEQNGLQTSKDKKQTQKDDLEPPPSSDRQSMKFEQNIPVQTEVKMS